MGSAAGPTLGITERDPGAAAAVRAASLAAGLLVGQQVAAKVARDAFFLSQFRVTALPLAVGGGAVVSLLAVAALSRVMARVAPGRLLPAMLWSSACLLVAEWALSLVAPRPAAAVVYVHMAVFGAAALSSFWAMVNERFDPHTARQAMGRIGTGASLGGVLAAALTWRVSRLVPVTALLLGLAVLLALAAASVQRLARSPPTGVRWPNDGADPRPTATETSWRVLAAMPYLRSLAALIALSAVLEALLDYAFSAAAVARFGQGESLVAFFAAFHTVTGVVSLVVQAVLVRRLLVRLGLARVLAVHPAAVAVLAGVTVAAPRMAVVVGMRAAAAVLRHSMFRSAYELFYTPLPRERKRPGKPLVDVGADRVGTIAGSVVTASVVAMSGPYSLRVLAALAAASALGMLAVVLRLHRAYITALVDSLRAGVVQLEQAEVLDATTRRAVEDMGPGPAPPPPVVAVAAGPGRDPEGDLRSNDAARIRAALSGTVLDAALVAVAVPLLSRDDLFSDVIVALRRAGPRCTGQLIDVLLDPTADPVVRRRVPRVLASVPTQRAADGLLAGLECDRLDVRYRSAQALGRLRQRATVRIAPEFIFAVAAREIDGRAGSGGARLEHVFAVLSLALDGEPIAFALRALRGTDVALRGTALEYLDHVLPASIRGPLWPRLGTTASDESARRSVDAVRDELLRSSSRVSAVERRTRHTAAP